MFVTEIQVLINIPVKLSTGNWIERLPFKRWRKPLTKRNSEDEKEKAREYFQEHYVQNPVGDLTCEQAWAQFVEYLKTTDSNA